jgi:signal transduction histidine kinase
LHTHTHTHTHVVIELLILLDHKKVLVNDVLDRAKLEEGKVKLELSEFDLHHLLADSLESFATIAASKDIGTCTTCCSLL